jgi:transcriptional regulator GlxA family with amidase domain
MAKRNTSVRRKGSAGLARETNLGRQLLSFNNDEIIQLLEAAVERERNQIAFARRHGLERTHLNAVFERKTLRE